MKKGAPGKTMNPSGATRLERDSMGELAVPAEAYYGVQTARALENFPISDLRFPRSFIRAMGLIKYAAATVNHTLGSLEKKHADVIRKAAREVIDHIKRSVQHPGLRASLDSAPMIQRIYDLSAR
jgi:fumarate hydratase class II